MIGIGYMVIVLFIIVICEEITTMSTKDCVISAIITPILCYLIGVCVQYIL